MNSAIRAPMFSIPYECLVHCKQLGLGFRIYDIELWAAAAMLRTWFRNKHIQAIVHTAQQCFVDLPCSPGGPPYHGPTRYQ